MSEANQLAHSLLELAGLSLPPEREEALVAGLVGTRRIAAALEAAGLEAYEPAAQFRAPPKR
jgi:hypothetical protein